MGMQHTGVSEVAIVLLGAGLALLEVFVFHFNKLDHVGCRCWFLL